MWGSDIDAAWSFVAEGELKLGINIKCKSQVQGSRVFCQSRNKQKLQIMLFYWCLICLFQGQTRHGQVGGQQEPGLHHGGRMVLQDSCSSRTRYPVCYWNSLLVPMTSVDSNTSSMTYFNFTQMLWTKILQQNPSWNKARSLQVYSAVKCEGAFSPLLEVIFFLIINFNLGLIYPVWKLINFLMFFFL